MKHLNSDEDDEYDDDDEFDEENIAFSDDGIYIDLFYYYLYLYTI